MKEFPNPSIGESPFESIKRKIIFLTGQILLIFFFSYAFAEPAPDVVTSAKEAQKLKEEKMNALFKGAAGVFVLEIFKNSQGEKAGIKRGDIITLYDGKPVNSPDDLKRFTFEKPESETVSIELIRLGAPLSIQLKGGPIGAEIRPATISAIMEAAKSNFKKASSTLDVPPPLPAALPEVMLKHRDEKVNTLFKGAGGVFILHVFDDSQGKKAGIKPGDIIILYDGKPVNSVGDLGRFSSEKAKSEMVSVELIRDGKPFAADLKGGKIGVGVHPATVTASAEAVLKLRDEKMNALLKGAGGVFIMHIFDDSQGMKAGIKPGDIVILYDGKLVNGPKALNRFTSEKAESETVYMELMRDGKRFTVKLKGGKIGVKTYPATVSALIKAVKRQIQNALPVLSASAETGLKLREKNSERFKGAAGVLVVNVFANSQGQKAGIKPGDIIIFYDGKPLIGLDDLGRFISEKTVSEIVSMELIRDGKPLAVNLKGGRIGVMTDGLENIRSRASDRLSLIQKTKFLLQKTKILEASTGGNFFRHEEVLEKLKEGLDIARKRGDREGAAQFLNRIGALYNDISQYDKALSAYRQALAVNREIKNRKGEGMNLGNIGGVLFHTGRYENALSHFKRALAIFRETASQKLEAAALSNIGLVCKETGRYDEALSHFRLARMLRKENEDQTDLNNMGLIYSRLGQHEKAISCFKTALTIARKIEYKQEEADTLVNLGVEYMSQGKFYQAMSFYEPALKIMRKTGDRRGESNILDNIGTAFHVTGQHEEALFRHEQALSAARDIGDRIGEAGALANIGTIHFHSQHYAEAEKRYAESLKICRQTGATEILWKILSGLAMAEVMLNRIGDAVAHYEEALDAVESMRENITGREFRIGFMRDKLHVYDSFIDLLMLLHQKYPDKGYDQKSLEIFERKQGRAFLEEMGQSGAKNFAGVPKSLTDQENALNRRSSELQARMTKEMLKPESERNMGRIRELERQAKTVEAKQRILQEQTGNDYPEYYALKHPKPVSLDELQNKVLHPGEMMLVYNVMEEISCVWVIGREHFSLHALDTGTEGLAQKIETWRTRGLGVSEQSRGTVIRFSPAKPAEVPDLYSLLFPKAVTDALSEAQLLYIIPTGPLYRLPFEVLNTGPAPTPRYLVERYTTAYLSSASLLKILRDARARRKQVPGYPLLAFANPVYEQAPRASSEENSERVPLPAFSDMRTEFYRASAGGIFPPLKETEDEVRAIRAILNAPDSSRPLWLKKEAARSNVFSLNQSQTLDDYRYLVFACHGVLPDDTTRIHQPALVLSHPEPETGADGFLTMADVFGISLNADMVTLSACNTGGGKAVKGEGVMGLTRAFMYAGTPAVTVTLWSVDSMSAKALNEGFFKHLENNETRVAALQKIKLAMLRGEIKDEKNGNDWKQPFYWAPTVVFGDGR